MKDSVRCCISCILPCGALDVIRIVHASGRVEEITGAVSAADIMQANPKHVLRKLPSSGGSSPRPLVLPPSAELQRGNIYFLMPVSSADKSVRPAPARRRRKKRAEESSGAGSSEEENRARLVLSDRYLSEILSENRASETQQERRGGRVRVWRPHLESIEEVDNDF